MFVWSFVSCGHGNLNYKEKKMKSLTKKVVLLMLTATLCSFASAKSGKSKPKIEYTLQSSHDMDANWDQYFNTGDETYLENILAYVDTEDLVMEKINKSAKKFLKDEKFVQSMDALGAEVVGGKFNLAYDLETMTGFFSKSQDLSEPLKYIYSFFPDDLFIRGVMKNTAFWSLASNAEQHDEINIALQKHIPYLNEKVRTSFYIYMGAEEGIGLVKSDKGMAEYSTDKIYIQPFLVNDLDKTVSDWVSFESDEMPEIKPSSEVNLKKGTDSISIFTVFCANEKCDYPLYFDCELINPDGTKSEYKGVKLDFVEKKPEHPDYLYAANQSYTWVFDKSDPNGKYTVRFAVYSAKKVVSVFDMTFSLKK